MWKRMKGGRRQKRRIVKIPPEQIKKATEDYLKNGGTITRAALGARKWEDNE